MREAFGTIPALSGSVRRVAFSVLTRGDPPPDPFWGRVGCRRAVCSRAGVAVGSLPRWSRGRQTYAPAAGGRCPLALARSVPGSSAVCRLYRSPGGSAPGPLSLPPKVPAAPRVPRPVATHAPTGPADHRARENPPLPGSHRARFTRAAPTDRGTRSTTATEPPLHPQNRRSEPQNV